MFKVGDKVTCKRFGTGVVISVFGGDTIDVKFDGYKPLHYGKNGKAYGLADDCTITLIEKEKEQVKFNVGDKVRLKKDFYKQDAFASMPRLERVDIAKQAGKILTFYFELDDRCGYDAPQCGSYTIPMQLLELVEEPKKEPKEYAKLCIDCNFMTTLLRDEPCSSCSNKSAWTPIKEAPEEPKAGDIIEHEGKKYRLVERKAKAGDLVSVNYETDRFKKGDIFKVTGVFTPHHDGEWAEYGDGMYRGKFFYEHQYLVLEPLMHQWTQAEIDECNRVIGDIFVNAANDRVGIRINTDDYPKEHIVRVQFYRGKEYTAKPISTDTPNKSIGMCVALCKATGREIPSFIKGDRK